MILDGLRSLGQDGFTDGYVAGALAAAVGVALSLVWPSSRRPQVAPVAGLLLAAAAVVALSRRFDLPDDLVPGLALLGIAGGLAATAARRFRAAGVFGLVLAVPGGWLVSGSTDVTGPRSRLLAVAVIAAAAALVASADHSLRHRALGPVLMALSVAGIYATVPDTERAIVFLGAAMPIALLGWPWAGASLGRAGAYAVVGLAAWVALTDGAARASSVVGSVACLGVLAVEPLIRVLRRSQRGSPRHQTSPPSAWQLGAGVVLAHLAAVMFASRVAGFRTSTVEAVLLAVLGLGALAVLSLRLLTDAAGVHGTEVTTSGRALVRSSPPGGDGG